MFCFWFSSVQTARRAQNSKQNGFEVAGSTRDLRAGGHFESTTRRQQIPPSVVGTDRVFTAAHTQTFSALGFAFLGGTFRADCGSVGCCGRRTSMLPLQWPAPIQPQLRTVFYQLFFASFRGAHAHNPPRNCSPKTDSSIKISFPVRRRAYIKLPRILATSLTLSRTLGGTSQHTAPFTDRQKKQIPAK